VQKEPTASTADRAKAGQLNSQRHHLCGCDRGLALGRSKFGRTSGEPKLDGFPVWNLIVGISCDHRPGCRSSAVSCIAQAARVVLLEVDDPFHRSADPAIQLTVAIFRNLCLCLHLGKPLVPRPLCRRT
jgi:hypothetical protein